MDANGTGFTARLEEQERWHKQDTGWKNMIPWPPDEDGDPPQWSVEHGDGYAGLSVIYEDGWVRIRGILTSIGRPIAAGYVGAWLPSGIPWPNSREPLHSSRVISSLSQALLPLGFVTIGADAAHRDRLMFSNVLGTGTADVRVLIDGWYKP